MTTHRNARSILTYMGHPDDWLDYIRELSPREVFDLEVSLLYRMRLGDEEYLRSFPFVGEIIFDEEGLIPWGHA